MKIHIFISFIFAFIILSLFAEYIGIRFSMDTYGIQSLLLLLMIGAIGCIYYFFVFNKRSVNFPKRGILMLLLIPTYQIIVSDISFELYSQILLFICYFTLFYQYFQQQKENGLYVISLIFTCLAIIIALVGFMQYIGVVNTENNFSVVGTFNNPAGIASMLVILLPFIFYLFKIKLKNNLLKNIILLLTITFVCIVVFISGSRSGIVSIVLVILLSSSFILKKKKTLLLVLILIPLSIPLYIFKKDSADGRIFIWSNTNSIIKDNLMLGTGYNGFTKKYMTYQAQYFKSNPQNDKTGIIASNVHNPMNEYLDFILSWGAVGIIIICTVFIYLLYIYRTNKDSFKSYAIISLIALAIFAFFSYPFSYPINQVILSLNLAIILCPASRGKDLNFVSKAFLRVIPILSLFFAFYAIYNEFRWKKAYDLSVNKTDTFLEKYEELNKHNYFNCNGVFLYNYAMILYENKEYSKCISILKNCENYINDYDTQMIAGYCYKEIWQWDKAKECFSMAHYMVPHKFVPIYELMEEAYEQKNIERTVALAKIIIEKPIKVKSYKINIIKNRANEILTILNKKGGGF
jgi:tetratricopeptide (TPR) repeat protein